MRNIFINKLIQASKKDPDIILLTSDLGFSAFEPYREQFPKQFYNIGVAENNMVGISTGLALAKKKIFLYSIIPFLIFRSFEQIKNNICYHNLNVKLIGTGGGLSYGVHGISHNPLEDFAIMRSLPNMTVFSPGSKIETDIIIDLMFDQVGPSFIRLGKVPDQEYHKKIPQ